MVIIKGLTYVLFGITAAFLYALALWLDSDYYTVNIWFYCIVGPVFFCCLMAFLWAETAYGVAANFKRMNIVSNLALAAVLLVLSYFLGKVVIDAAPVLQALAAGDKTQLFKNCTHYLTNNGLGMSFVSINVLYFCLLGPAVFIILIILVATGMHRFRWHWLAALNEPHAWRYWLNAAVLACCIPCCRYALYVLRHYALLL